MGIAACRCPVAADQANGILKPAENMIAVEPP